MKVKQLKGPSRNKLNEPGKDKVWRDFEQTFLLNLGRCSYGVVINLCLNLLSFCKKSFLKAMSRAQLTCSILILNLFWEIIGCISITIK